MNNDAHHFTATAEDGEEHCFSRVRLSADRKTLHGVTDTLPAGVYMQRMTVAWAGLKLDAALVMVRPWQGAENEAEFRLSLTPPSAP